jgi:hypothetical protein
MKKLLVLAVISTCAFAGWRVMRGGDDVASVAQHDNKLVLDRIWIDHMPKHERDQISAFLAITDEPVGVFQTASMWKGHYELFRYEAHGGEIRILFPQDNHRERVKAKAHRCDQGDFDYCLELDGASRGVKRYYSRKGWEIDGARSPDELRARIEAVLQAK